MLERLDLLGMELAEMQGLKRGRVRVAMITTAKYFATRLIGEFCRAHRKSNSRSKSSTASRSWSGCG